MGWRLYLESYEVKGKYMKWFMSIIDTYINTLIREWIILLL